MPPFTDLIRVSELQSALGQSSWHIVDCRFDLLNPDQGRNDFLNSHIPGAVYAHLDDDLAAPVTATSGRHPLPEADEFAATLSVLGISNGDQVVAYDAAGGAIAARLWWMMHWLGHAQVAVLNGGFAAWQRAGMATEKGEAAVSPGTFVGRAQTDRVLGTTELAAGLATKRAALLVDAREPQRYSGAEEPIDSAAGHIPGATNFPYAQNLAEDGCWQPVDVLRKRWQGIFPDGPADDWAVMCGSGVTACHLALSAALVGLPLPRLYAGSWSEWIRDPARPREP